MSRKRFFRSRALRADCEYPDIRARGPILVPRAGRLESIQLLRAAAAIGVVFTHAITRISTTFPQISHHSLFVGSDGQLTVGDAGVDLFFVISGFIMLHVHRHDFQKPGASMNFIARRIIRIVPIYWVLTTMALAFLILQPQLFTTHYRGIDLPWIIGSYLFLPIGPPGWENTPLVGVGWTLNFEMLFYAVFAAALLLPQRRGLQLIFLCFGSLVLSGVFWKPANAVFSFVTNWLLLDFLMGIAIAWWMPLRHKSSGAEVGIMLFSGVAGLSATIFWPPPEVGPLRFLSWGIPAALIVLGMSSVKMPDGKLGRLGSRLGDASYSIYLFQFFALPGWAWVMRAGGAEVLPFDAGVLILTTLVTISGFGCWLLVERPLGKAVRSWFRA